MRIINDETVSIIEKLKVPENGRIFNITGNNKCLWCPFKPVICQEGYCRDCQLYITWLGDKGDD